MKCLVYFALISFHLYEMPIFARETILWRNLQPSENLDMMVLDDFEEKLPWTLGNSLGIASKLRFVYKNPAHKDIHNLGDQNREQSYQNDLEVLGKSAKIHGRTFQKNQNYSQELIAYFANPGADAQVIEVPEKDRRFIQGRIVALSVWVYGLNKKHVLYALFSNQVQEKIPVKIGDLYFRGWKRFEIPVPGNVARRSRLNQRLYEFRFDGFKIASHPHESVGNFLFLHDLVSVLIDRTQDAYSGNKIKDDWK